MKKHSCYISQFIIRPAYYADSRFCVLKQFTNQSRGLGTKPSVNYEKNC